MLLHGIISDISDMSLVFDNKVNLKREILLTINGEMTVVLEQWNKNIDKRLTIGSEVNAKVILEARKKQDRWFNNVKVENIEIINKK